MARMFNIPTQIKLPVFKKKGAVLQISSLDARKSICVRLLIVCMLFITAETLLMSEETEKTRTVLRAMTQEEIEDYVRQQSDLAKIDYGRKNDKSVKSPFVSRILKIISDDIPQKQSFLNPPIMIGTNDIPGYLCKNVVTRSSKIDEYRNCYQFEDTWQFQFKPNEWIGSTDKLSNDKGEIEVKTGVFDSRDVASIQLVQWNFPPSNSIASLDRNLSVPFCFRIYRIKEGPGDVCLVSVLGEKNFPFEKDSMTMDNLYLCNRSISFIRGNVAVCVVSSYKNFGCMDLACKLDAFIVKKMREAAEKR